MHGGPGHGDRGFSPEAIFVIAGISQNIGSILAKSLFDEVAPATVAWIRICFASLVLLGLSWRHWGPWSREPWGRADLTASAVFGIATALMNTFFFLGIDRLDLGKGVTIEFLGPIAVAASRTRTRRNAIAVGLAVIGVILLSGIELGRNKIGLLFILAASAMWAIYIVVGTKVARQERGLAGLGVGLLIGSVVITPLGLPGSAVVFSNTYLLVMCCLVGLFGSVISYGLDQHVMRRIPPGRFALLLALLPVTATFIAFIALDERPTPIEYIGIALVVAGVAYQQRDEPLTMADEPAQ